MPSLFSPNGAANAVPVSQSPNGGAASASNIINKGTITLATPSDLTIRILGPKDEDGKQTLHILNASKEKVSKNSKWFENCLKYPLDKKVVEFDNDHAEALLIWCAYFHELDKDHILKFVKTPGIADVWHVIRMGDKYLFDGKFLENWFNDWYIDNVDIGKMTESYASQLALPCICFNYAEGFAEITKWLAYNNVGHISEVKPVHFKWQHQHLAPLDFVGPMNHARGGLRRRIEKYLNRRTNNLLDSRDCECGHWDSTVGQFLGQLRSIQVYPLEDYFPKASVNIITTRLKKFSFEVDGAASDCDDCGINWEREVGLAKKHTEDHFDGLCLDCMDHSRPKRKDTDEDYWKHLRSVKGRWDTKCRINHGEQTWYVSWCGRDEHRQKLIAAHNDENDIVYRR